MVKTQRVRIETKGDGDVIDITGHLARAIAASGLQAGTATVFVAHSTCAVSTVEYEPGLVSDLKELFERLAPRGIPYGHDRRWGDGNGHAHVRATLTGPSLVVPFAEGRPLLGTWQQVVLIDFDIHPRTRQVIFQLVGE